MAKKRVLIVEDEHNIAKAEELILGDDFEVFIANDGESGLKMVKDLKPHLIILDLMLPNRGGYDICFNVRQDPVLRDTKILMVTAKNQDIDKDKGVLVGADDYMTKPFEAAELLKRSVDLLK
ncbi:MAG: response regulator [Candidatus Woesearchaeota archaeon]